MSQPPQFTDEMLTRPGLSGIDVTTTLRHFAIITYEVDPERLQAHLHPRFTPDCIQGADGSERALISVVPFLDLDFRFASCPWPTFAFGQTNYRAYVIDSETGERVVWFFGTCLDSWSVLVPRVLWKLPWHRGRIHFDCEYSSSESRYRRYRMQTRSPWAPAEVELQDSGVQPRALRGFSSLESGLVVLTHPLRGYFFRRDGRLGTYDVWHDRLRLTEGSCLQARFPLLEKLGLVPLERQAQTHSVLIQPSTEFLILLPPRLGETPGLG